MTANACNLPPPAVSAPSRPLTAVHYAELRRDSYPAVCRLCGDELRPGDRIDVLHPWNSRGNLHNHCEGAKP